MSIPSFNPDELLWIALTNGDFDLADQAVNAGADVHVGSDWPLMYTLENGSLGDPIYGQFFQ